MQRRLLTLATWSALMLPAAPALAQTLIAPGQTFMLGGEQDRPVTVEGRNTGTVAVELLRRAASGTESSIQRVAPGQAFNATLPARETALARNPSPDRAASVKFVFNGQINSLSMRYDKP